MHTEHHSSKIHLIASVFAAMLLPATVTALELSRTLTSDAVTTKSPQQLEVVLYDSVESSAPLRTIYLVPGEFSVERGAEQVRLRAELSDDLAPAGLWAETILDGQLIGDRLHLVAADVGITFASGNHLNMDGNTIFGLATPVENDEAANKGYVDTAISTGTAASAGTATTATSLAAEGANCGAGEYPLGVDTQGNAQGCTADGLGTHTAATTLDMNANTISNLADPAAAQDATTKTYVDTGVQGAKDYADAQGVPAGHLSLSTSPVSPSGYTFVGNLHTPELWGTRTAMPTARYQLAAAAIDGILYAVGGWRSGPLAINQAYDPVSNSWSSKAAMPTARDTLAATAIDGILYAVGGFNSGYLATNQAYDPLSNSWSSKTAMPTARQGLAAVAIDGILYAVGGWNNGALATNEAYDPVGNSWSSKAAMPTARALLSAAAIDGTLYAVGGFGGSILATNEAYDPVGNSWSSKASMPTARNNFAAATIDGILYAVGGHNGGAVATNEAYDPLSNSWSSKTAMPTAQYGSAAAAIDGILYAVGGYNGSNSQATNEAYTPQRVLYLHQKN